MAAPVVPINITVIRGVGANEGEDIFEPLLATQALAMQRGEQELNDQSQPTAQKQVTIPFQAGLERGLLARVTDSLQGLVYVGKISGVRHTVQMDPPESVTVVDLEVPVFDWS